MLNFIVLEVAYSPSPFNLATRVRSLPRRPCFFSEGGGGLVTQSSPNFKADEQNRDYKPCIWVSYFGFPSSLRRKNQFAILFW